VTIHIEVKKENDILKIVVTNPFDPQTASPRRGTGFGLNSVKRRLYLLFARTDLVDTATDGRIFTTTINIPRHENPDH